MSDPDTSADPAAATPQSEPAVQFEAAAASDVPVDIAADDAPPPIAATEPEPADPELTPDEPAAPEPVPHAGARYTLLRLLMLVAVAGILYVLGMRGWLLAFAAVLVSGVLSLFLLMKQRNDAAVSLQRSLDSRKSRRDHEDAGLTQE
jgi:hypothetical protein